MRTLILVGAILSILVLTSAQSVSQLRMGEIADLYGYQNEIHLLEARDGFILSLFRIMGREGQEGAGSRGPLLFYSGLNTDARNFLHQGPDNSLPFVLVNQGYEVWMVNPRASETSRAHVDRSPDGNPETCTQADPYNNPCLLGAINTHQYFNLTYEDYGDDMYEFYQYISSLTGSDSFPSFCQSNGCSYLAAGMSMHADYFNDAMTLAMLNAPFIEKGHTTSWMMRAFAMFLPFLSFIDNNLGFGLLLDTNIFRDAYRMVCPIMPSICIASFTTGMDQNPTIIDLDVAVEALTTPGNADIPLRIFEHIGQNVRDRAFRHFDYGPQGNLERYGSEQHPLFPLEDIQIPIALFFTEFDNAVSETDRELLIQDFGDNIVFNELYPFNHNSLGVDILEDRQQLIDDIVSVLGNY